MKNEKVQTARPSSWTAMFCTAAVLSAVALGGCVPLVVGGAVVGGMVATDRRTSGAQLEDEGIELRSGNALRGNLSDRSHVNVTSFNRQVLLTGEVPTAQERQLAEQVVTRIENVRAVVNELGVMPPSALTQRSNDAFITGKVKASLLDAKDLFANSIKVFTERNVVYIMGRLTPREAKRAAEIARGVSGVDKVVRVVELITEEELRRGSTGVDSRAPAAAYQAPQPAYTAPPPAPAPETSGGAVVTPVSPRSSF